MVKIVCISDTHLELGNFEIPEGDILIHAGDLSIFGTLEEIRPELEKLSELPYKHKIFIAGNHDKLFESSKLLARAILEDFPSLTYLEDNLTKVEGITVYGCPWVPRYHGWAFMLPRGGEILKKKYRKIPEGIDILVTHAPPLGILDINYLGVSYGSRLLREELKRIKPKYHIFGHIHESSGIKVEKDITYINASICVRDYSPNNKAQSIEYS